MTKKIPCHRCGSTEGYYSKFKGIQYYTAGGEPEGWDTDFYVAEETKTIRCRNCDAKTTMASLEKRIKKAELVNE